MRKSWVTVSRVSTFQNCIKLRVRECGAEYLVGKLRRFLDLKQGRELIALLSLRTFGPLIAREFKKRTRRWIVVSQVRKSLRRPISYFLTESCALVHRLCGAWMDMKTLRDFLAALEKAFHVPQPLRPLIRFD